MRKKITISFDEETLKQCDERAKELNMTRSEYIKSLILRELRALRFNSNKNKRRISDFENRGNP
jgi:metal-responsive CopG/Arc/MetJ family transcriptional regulator